MHAELHHSEHEHNSLLANAEVAENPDEAVAAQRRRHALCALGVTCVALFAVWVLSNRSSHGQGNAWSVGSMTPNMSIFSTAARKVQNQVHLPRTTSIQQTAAASQPHGVCQYAAAQVHAGAVPTCEVGHHYTVGHVCKMDFAKHLCESTRCMQGIGMDSGHARFSRQEPLCVALASDPVRRRRTAISVGNQTATEELSELPSCAERQHCARSYLLHASF